MKQTNAVEGPASAAARRRRAHAAAWVGLLAATVASAAAPRTDNTATAADAAARPRGSALRAITHEDLWLMQRVTAPSVSPDGRWVVFTVTEPAYDEASQVADLWIVPTDGSARQRRLTTTRARETSVSWSPDSTRIAFSSRRDGDEVEQIYVLPLFPEGGEARRVTSLSTGARTPVFSPDGRRIAFVSSVFPGTTTDAENRERLAQRKARKWNARIYEGFPIRNWDKWLDERQVRLFVQDLPSGAPTASPPARDLLAGSKLVQKPGYTGRRNDTGDELDVVWTPDGRELLFVASEDRDRAAYAFTSTQIWRISADERMEPVRVTSGAHNWQQPRFSADGRTLLALAERESDKVYVKTELGAFDWPQAREPRWITRDFDRSITTYAVSNDSRRVYMLAEEAGHEQLYGLVLARSGAVRRISQLDVGVYFSLQAPETRGARDVLIATHESSTRPPEIVRIDPSRGSFTPLTDFNGARLAALDLPPLRHFSFRSSRGRQIHNMLVVPPGFDPAKKYPLFAVIHGGPHTMWRDQWFLRWNYQLLASPGYVLLLTNYSGSTGFGEAFAQHIQGDPLRTAGEEINEAADEAIRRHDFIDGTRQCAGGASYGGHLANWLQGTTERYRCFVSHAGLVNVEAQWGTSDTVYGREVNSGGPVWEQGAVWREQNPIRYAARFKTPTLVTIGENDFRVPLNNALEYWTVLQRQRVPSRLVVFPDENHWILKGENSRLFYAEVHAWLERWLKPDARAAAQPVSTAEVR